MARRKLQQEFTGKGFAKPGDSFGGALLKGNPKRKRPLESKLPIHLTLRATKSTLRTPKTQILVAELVYGTAKKYGVTIYQFANVGNHLHVLIKISRVGRWSAFIRELTGRIAQVVSTAVGLSGAFWLYRPHTRIVRGWNRAYKTAKLYVHLNWLQAEGFISRKDTKTLKDLRAFFDGRARSPKACPA